MCGVTHMDSVEIELRFGLDMGFLFFFFLEGAVFVFLAFQVILTCS